MKITPDHIPASIAPCDSPLDHQVHGEAVQSSRQKTSLKLLVAAGLLSLSEAACVFDGSGSCEKDCVGGTTSSMTSSSTGENMGGSGGMINTGNTTVTGTGGMMSTSSGMSSTGSMNAVGGGGAGGSGGGCDGELVTFDNMDEYALRVYRDGCDEVNAIFSSYVDGASAFTTGSTEVCVKPDDVVIAQVKDPADSHSLEFMSGVTPVQSEVRKISSGTPASYAEMNGFCAASSGYLPVIDMDPAAMGYKFEGNPVLDPSDGFRIQL